MAITKFPALNRVKALTIMLLVLFQVLTVLTILGLSHYGTEEVLLQQAHRTLATATKESAAHTRSFLHSANETVETTALMFSSGVIEVDDQIRLENYFVNVLDQHTAISGIYIGTLSGEFLYVTRSTEKDKTFRVKSKSASEPGARLWWHSAGEAPAEPSYDPADSYDPRTRPWFENAVSSNGFVWTDPYIFFTAQRLGITAAKPAFDTEGELIGVVGVDLELDALAGFLSTLEIGESGSAFISNSDGILIAAPFVDEPTQIGSNGPVQRELLTVDTVSDIAGRQALRIIQAAVTDGTTDRRIRFAVSGEDYLSAHRPLKLSDGSTWLIGAFAAENDFVRDIRAKERNNLVLGCLVLAISMCAGWFLAVRAWTPVQAWHSQAHRDQLTQLFNRHYLNNNAERIFSEANENGTPISAVIIDIDHFKRINDTFGHGVGDEVIKEFAQRLRSAARIGDVVARLGGEEFLMLLPTATPDIAESITTKIACWFKDEPIETDAGPLDVRFSAGIATLDEHNVTYASVICRADKALYAAKNAGRDRIQISQPESAKTPTSHRAA
ncbi:MAG: diguanylate cyclase [Gammaproteobacteria bacterium]|nr:diguanylate cyclase [Gammaproteobacteria bacterium]